MAKPNKFFITDEQKRSLKELLTQEEYEGLIGLTDEAFFDELGGYIDVRVRGGEPTDDGVKLDDIYYEIYNQYD